MRDLITFAFGLCTGLCGAVFYMLISNKQGKRIQSKNRSQSLQKRRTQAEHGILKVRQDQIEGIERQFFKGIERKLTLTKGQITDLKTFLKMSSDDNKDQFEICQNLQDILIRMKAVRLITAGRYRGITAILTEAGIDASPITWHIEQLSYAYEDVINGFEPRGFEADPFDYDAMIIHCEEDRDKVKAFIDNSTDTLNIPDLSLCLFEEFNISQPKLQSIVNVLLCARYVYVFVTPNLTTDKLSRFMTSMALTDSLLVEEKNWRIIPIWATEDFVYFPELGVLSGLKYWKFFDQIHKDDFLKTYRNHILKGRNEIKQARDTFNVQYTVHVQGKRCFINVKRNISTIVLTGPGNILWRVSTFKRLTAKIYDQQFGNMGNSCVNELTSTPTGPRHLSNKTPQLSPIIDQSQCSITQSSKEDALTLISAEISALREVLISIQDQMKQMTGQISTTHQKIDTLMEQSIYIRQGVQEMSDEQHKGDGTCYVTISETVGDETRMTPGKISYSEAVSRTPVKSTSKGKPTPAPRKTLINQNETKEDQPKKVKSNQPKSKNGHQTIKTKNDLKSKSAAPTTPTMNNKILILGDSILSGVNHKGLARNVVVQPFPGATVETIMNKISMYNLNQFESVVIYVGGNDAARSRDPDMEYFEEKYDQLIKFIKIQNPNCLIYMCNMCPRGDVETKQTNDVIKRLSRFHGVVYINAYTGFYDKQNTLRTYFYGERDWIHLSQSGIKRLLGIINSQVFIVENFEKCAYPAPSKHDPRGRQPQRKQQIHHQHAESQTVNEETYRSQRDHDHTTNIEHNSSDRCMKCGLRNHTTEECWHRVQVRCFSCKFYGHKDADCWNTSR